MQQNRFTSKVAWAAAASAILAILVAFGAIDVGQSEAINVLVTAVLGVLTLFGILNNPTDKTGF